MTLTAPYSNAMRLGQGFNTYTQEVRIENAVKIVQTSVANGASTAHAEDSTQAVRPPGDTSSAGRPNTTDPNEPLATKGASNAAGEQKPGFSNASLVSEATNVLTNQNGADLVLPFDLPKTPPPKSSQIVTYSTRAIDNVSDIMDALNISTAMSIKYGTIHGNGSASFVNENKVLDSQLNYIVSVKVNNNAPADPDDMDFRPIEHLPPDKFTEVYGDTFISGFLEGGEFNAVISVDVHDKSKLRSVKQAIDVSLAVGPAPVTVGAQEAVDKEHRELLQDTEITISVNWSGGGEVKRPGVPWSLSSVVQVANAFPSMVARCSAKTSAVLTKYTSLRSFQNWRYTMAEKNPAWLEKDLILNYTPCQLYTNDLFDAFMSYKKLWKRIDFIMQDLSKWKARDPPEKAPQPVVPAIQAHGSANGAARSPVPAPPVLPADYNKENIQPKDYAVADPNPLASPRRSDTFDVDDPLITEEWDLQQANANREPIPLDPVALNEARLLCREAMTLITEEAAHLVDHPKLAYAKFIGASGKTKMKRPNYAYPEVLKGRLPVYIRNDAADDSYSRDAAAIKVQTYSHNSDLFSHIVGDTPNPHRKYKPFVSLDMNESHGGRDRALCGLSLHAYHHHHLAPGHFSKDSSNAIGGIGFRFEGDKDVREDGCSQHIGHVRFDDSSKFAKFDMTTRSISAPSAANGMAQPPKTTEIDITRVDVAYVPGSGRIAALTFFDKFGDGATARLTWKQWGATGREPEGLKVVKQEPPVDGARWKFVGLCGELDESIWGQVLSRVGGIWRRV